MWVCLVVYVLDMKFQPASMEWNFGPLFPVTQVGFSKRKSAYINLSDNWC